MSLRNRTGLNKAFISIFYTLTGMDLNSLLSQMAIVDILGVNQPLTKGTNCPISGMAEVTVKVKVVILSSYSDWEVGEIIKVRVHNWGGSESEIKITREGKKEEFLTYNFNTREITQ